MKIAYRHFLLCILLLSGCLSTAFAKDHVVWRLGEKDGFCREFALHDVAYSDFSKRYTCVTTICQIGTDDSRKIPCAFPGPKDVWAGKQSGELLVRFGVGRIAPQTRARLVLDFVEVHPYSPPVLEITVNGFRTKVQTPAGKTPAISRIGPLIRMIWPLVWLCRKVHCRSGKTGCRSGTIREAGLSGML